MERKNIFDLSGRIAFITGGGSGLGRAYSEAMAEFGADVACIDIIEERAQETVNLINKHAHRAIAMKADVSNEDNIRNVVARTVKELGAIDIVFANAGFLDQAMVRIHEESVAEWDRVFATVLRGTFLLMRVVLPIMMKKGGSFVTTASMAGMWPVPPGGINNLSNAYNCAKGGVILLTKLAARQYGEFGIRVNAICPGYHRTAIARKERHAEVEKIVLPLTPLKRIGMPEDIKGLAVYLASDASRFVTGQTFVEDGGYIA